MLFQPVFRTKTTCTMWQLQMFLFVADIFSSLPVWFSELQMQLSQSNSERAVEGDGREHELVEPKLPELEDGPVAYVRSLLIASGLYDGLSDPCTSRMEPSAKPIATSVYEEVEVSYKQQDKDEAGHGSAKDDNGDEVGNRSQGTI